MRTGFLLEKSTVAPPSEERAALPPGASSSCKAAANVLAALAGSMYAFYIGYIEPSYLSIAQSLAKAV